MVGSELVSYELKWIKTAYCKADRTFSQDNTFFEH